jgi:hypothetical protein
MEDMKAMHFLKAWEHPLGLIRASVEACTQLLLAGAREERTRHHLAAPLCGQSANLLTVICIRHGRGRVSLLGYNYAKSEEDQSCLDQGEAKSPHAWMKSHGTYVQPCISKLMICIFVRLNYLRMITSKQQYVHLHTKKKKKPWFQECKPEVSCIYPANFNTFSKLLWKVFKGIRHADRVAPSIRKRWH